MSDQPYNSERTLRRWTDNRLARLFTYYNRKYWDNSLPFYEISGKLNKELRSTRALGLCDNKSRAIFIDVSAHKSEKALRETVLHEMVHAAAGDDSIAHGYRFWAEMERLLKLRAPINPGMAEAPLHPILIDIVPLRFKFCRRALARAEATRMRRVLRITRGHESFEIDDDYVTELFENAAQIGPNWKEALWVVSNEIGLLDVGGKPKNSWARRAIQIGKSAFRKRRHLLERAKVSRKS